MGAPCLLEILKPRPTSRDLSLGPGDPSGRQLEQSLLVTKPADDNL